MIEKQTSLGIFPFNLRSGVGSDKNSAKQIIKLQLNSWASEKDVGTLWTLINIHRRYWRCKRYITWFMSWIIRQRKVLRTPLLSHSQTVWTRARLLPPSARVHWGHHDVYAKVCLLSRGLLSVSEVFWFSVLVITKLDLHRFWTGKQCHANSSSHFSPKLK